MPAAKRTAASESPVQINVNAPTPAAVAETLEEKPPLEPNWFFDKLGAIPPSDWSNLYLLEIFRLEPKLPSVPGSKGFLDVFTEPVSKAQIKQRYGGGKFRLVLLKNNKYVTSHDFDIEGEPIYARGREVAPDNGSSALEGRLLDMLQTNLKEMKEELRRREANGSPDPAFQKSIDMMSTTYQQLLSASAGKAENPTALLRELVSTAKDMGLFPGNGAANSSNPFLDKLLEAAIPLLIGALKPKSLADQVAEYEAMDKIFGGRGGARDWKGVLADKVGDALPDLLNTIGNNARRRVPAAALRPNPQPTQTMRPSVQPNVTPMRPQATPTPTAPPPAAGLRIVSPESGETPNGGRENPPPSSANAPEVTTHVSPEILPTEEEIYFAGIKRRIVQCVQNGDEGALIVDFLEVAWPQMVNYLEALDAEKLTGFLAQDPILAEAVNHRNWRSVLGQAQTYLHEDLPTDAVPS